MKRNAVQRMVMTAVFAALVCLMTAFLFHIPVGTTGGYIHFGDAFVYLAAAFLPAPYAMAAAGVGAGLADVLAGAPHWAPFTVVIKAAMTACFTHKNAKVLCVRNAIAAVAAGIVGMAGYYLAEALLFGNWLTPLWSLLTGGSVQAVGGAVLFWLCGAALDRANGKSRLK